MQHFTDGNKNLASIYLYMCGDNWVTDDVEIVFPISGDRGQNDAPSSGMLNLAW
jgi:hypothetical protein